MFVIDTIAVEQLTDAIEDVPVYDRFMLAWVW